MAKRPRGHNKNSSGDIKLGVSFFWVSMEGFEEGLGLDEYDFETYQHLKKLRLAVSEDRVCMKILRRCIEFPSLELVKNMRVGSATV